MWWLWRLYLAAAFAAAVYGGDVTYDGRSLIINGERKLLFSGSIHYPRSTPDTWPSLIKRAKNGGLDVIETYVFWNEHEPQPGQFDFSGRKDIVSFIKEIQAHGLYACVRFGPYIQSEISYGGFPFWLHDVPGIIFRSDNEPFKIENEYSNVEKGFEEKGPPYVRWAAQMAVGLQTGVPWVMCKQIDAPDPVAYIFRRNSGECVAFLVNSNRNLSATVQFQNSSYQLPPKSISILPDCKTQNSGPYLERRALGLSRAAIKTSQGRQDLRHSEWGYQVGLLGEKLQIFEEDASNKVQWSKFSYSKQPLIWYKSTFDAPSGNGPIALNLGSMGKGHVWVNGQSIGRYWVSFRTPSVTSSQSWYNIPRSFVRASKNSVVLFEEEGGNPLGITIDSISISKVCGHVGELHPPPVRSWKKRGMSGPKLQLHCPQKQHISRILFASFGTPTGDCAAYALGSCHSPNSQSIVEKVLLLNSFPNCLFGWM
nr:beta-galactosidase 16-like [Ipomoea batatas]